MLLRERLKRRDKVEVETHEPKIPYRETIQTNADGSYRHKKQSGGSGQFGEVHIRMYPFPEGTTPEEFATKERFPHLKNMHFHEKNNFLWVDTVVGGTIPGNFMPAIEKGFLEKISQRRRGRLPGAERLRRGVFRQGPPGRLERNGVPHRRPARRSPTCSSEARPSLLEPIVKLHITVPVGNVGDVSSDLSGRRGQMVGMDSAGGGMTTVEATAPLAEVMTYARTLSSMTGGQGSYTMEFSRYDVVPANVQQQIIAQGEAQGRGRVASGSVAAAACGLGDGNAPPTNLRESLQKIASAAASCYDNGTDNRRRGQGLGSSQPRFEGPRHADRVRVSILRPAVQRQRRTGRQGCEVWPVRPQDEDPARRVCGGPRDASGRRATARTKIFSVESRGGQGSLAVAGCGKVGCPVVGPRR